MTKLRDGDRLARAARNQAIFRAVNERLEELATTFEDVAGMSVFTCECADLTCVEQIEMTVDEYESVRSEPNQFAIAPGHVYPDVENVVRENERFVVVAKIAEAAKVAAEADPRS